MPPAIAPHYATPFGSRFDGAFARILKEEGGYVNHPSDPGGATNLGISLRFLKAEGRFDLNGDGFADFDLDLDGDIDGEDVRDIGISGAAALYHRCFWQKLDCGRFPAPLGEMLFDQSVNGGLVAAVKILQRAINFASAPGVTVVVDGQLGPVTREAADRVIRYPAKGMPALVVGFREMAKARYRSLVKANGKLACFLKGWLARADRLGRA